MSRQRRSVKIDKNNESSSDDEWEEVPDLPSQEDHQQQISERIPESGLVITIPQVGGPLKKVNKYDPRELFRLQLNREVKDRQVSLHKVSVLCHLARLVLLNDLLCSDELRAMAMSQVGCNLFNIPSSNLDRDDAYLVRVLGMVRRKFRPWYSTAVEPNHDMLAETNFDDVDTLDGIEQVLKQYFNEEECLRYLKPFHRVLLAVLLLRAAGFEVRLIHSMQPLPLRPSSDELLKKPVQPKEDEGDTGITPAKTDANDDDPDYDSESEAKTKKKKIGKGVAAKKKNNVKSKDVEPGPSTSSKSKARKTRRSSSDQEDRDFESLLNPKKNSQSKKITNFLPVDDWVEVYIPRRQRWVPIDLEKYQASQDAPFEAKASKPMLYVLGIDNDGKVKDVTRRYVSKWLQMVVKSRADSDWFDETLEPYRTFATARDTLEDDLLDKLVAKRSYPENVSELINHPLYVAEKHLKKFEVIYPPNPHPVGVIKCIPFYQRSVVTTLHSREAWLKEAKVVKLGEAPYKLVKGRPKMVKQSTGSWASVPRDQDLELFGYWQVTDYMPPVAKDGKVPRSAYGNVELYKPEMVPKGAVHLVLPGLDKVAKKLDIDCAPALTGFEFSGISRPVFDGFVVCEEFKEILLDAWNQDQDEQVRKAEEKRRARVVGNWRRLFRLVIIKIRLDKKYNLGAYSSSESRANQSQSSSFKSNNVTKRAPAKRKKETSATRSSSPPPKKGRKLKK